MIGSGFGSGNSTKRLKEVMLKSNFNHLTSGQRQSPLEGLRSIAHAPLRTFVQS